MCSSSPSTTIYVGNIQSIKDEQLREYFQQFGRIEAFYHNCTRAEDEWLIDYRFIRFSADTDMKLFLTNKLDHTICRIRLDIHPYDDVFRDETRLILDRKICVGHTDVKVNRNLIRKAFTKYGRILNCTCVSSGNGFEYTYIEFESVNSIQSVFANNQRHFAGRTSLAVRRALRPSQVGPKLERLARENKEPAVSRFSQHPRSNSNFEIAQYSSISVHRHNSVIQAELRTSTPLFDQSSPDLTQSSVSSNDNENNAGRRPTESSQICSDQQLKDYEKEYDLIIQQDFDEITYQTETLLRNQRQTYRKLHEFLFRELQSHASSSSSSDEEGEIVSRSSSSTSESEHCQYRPQKKRPKSHR